MKTLHDVPFPEILPQSDVRSIDDGIEVFEDGSRLKIRFAVGPTAEKEREKKVGKGKDISMKKKA